MKLINKITNEQKERALMKPFYIEIPNFWAWADNLGR